MVSPKKSIPIPFVTPSSLRNLWSHIKHPNACWNWAGAIRATYGEIGFGKKTYRVHRVMFEWFKGEIPKGLTIDHLCNNRLCVNPDHLILSTQKDNVGRALKVAYCRRGHLQSPENRYTAPGSGRSRCKPCIMIRNKKRHIRGNL